MHICVQPCTQRAVYMPLHAYTCVYVRGTRVCAEPSESEGDAAEEALLLPPTLPGPAPAGAAGRTPRPTSLLRALLSCSHLTTLLLRTQVSARASEGVVVAGIGVLCRRDCNACTLMPKDGVYR